MPKSLISSVKKNKNHQKAKIQILNLKGLIKRTQNEKNLFFTMPILV